MRLLPLLLLAGCASPVAGPAAGSEEPSPTPSRLAVQSVVVPAGSVWLGSPDDEAGRDADEHRVLVQVTKPFALGVREVDRALWRRVMGSDAPGRDTWTDEHPATVSWTQAVAFCNALSTARGLAPAYGVDGDAVNWDPAAPGYRLPTEAEWALAASAGGTRYAGGDELSAVGWCGAADLQPVARLAANPLGFFDLTGNAEEWVWDRYSPSAPTVRVDPEGPSSGEQRVARGGNWGDDATHCRLADRSGFEPGLVTESLGFRVARNR